MEIREIEMLPDLPDLPVPRLNLLLDLCDLPVLILVSVFVKASSILAA